MNSINEPNTESNDDDARSLFSREDNTASALTNIAPVQPTIPAIEENALIVEQETVPNIDKTAINGELI